MEEEVKVRIKYPLSKEEAIIIATRKNGNAFKYDTLPDNLESRFTRVDIICSKCGLVKNTVWKEHIEKGAGCRKCSNANSGSYAKLSDEEIKSRIESSLPGVFSFENYVREGDRVHLTCKEHGPVLLPVRYVTQGSNGCVGCSGGARITKTSEEFIAESKEKFEDRFDYSEVEYVNNKTEVILTCLDHGLKFSTVPQTHLSNTNGGCPECRANKTLTTEEFIQRSKELFPEMFTYEKTEYVNNRVKVLVTCIKHQEEFLSLPRNHLNHTAGCPRCGLESRISLQTYSSEKWIEIFTNRHGDRYDYSNSKILENEPEKINVSCRKHGEFITRTDGHSAGHGCPICGGTSSAGEQELSEFLLRYFPDLIRNDRELIKPKEVDILIPSRNIAIEYNGLYSHSEECGKDKFYHLRKTKACQEKGVQLFHVFENEWIEDRTKIEKFLLNKLGVKTGETLFARKLEVGKIEFEEAKAFLITHHLQDRIGKDGKYHGLKNGSRHYGLKNSGELVAVMSFSDTETETELSRFCSSGRVLGGFSKLLAASLKDRKVEVISFSDNRWGVGEVYSSNGFTLEHENGPDYYWCKNQMKNNKRGFQHQYLPKVIGDKYDPLKTEEENCLAAGYFKVWDCGKKKWRLRV